MNPTLPVITMTTSSVHLANACKAFSKCIDRDELIAIANKHKPYMLDADVIEMRRAFARQQIRDVPNTADPTK